MNQNFLANFVFLKKCISKFILFAQIAVHLVACKPRHQSDLSAENSPLGKLGWNARQDAYDNGWTEKSLERLYIDLQALLELEDQESGYLASGFIQAVEWNSRRGSRWGIDFVLGRSAAYSRAMASKQVIDAGKLLKELYDPAVQKELPRFGLPPPWYRDLRQLVFYDVDGGSGPILDTSYAVTINGGLSF